MKELFLHLWKTSRLFQVALVVGVLAAGWGLFGRPSTAVPNPVRANDDLKNVKEAGVGVVSNAAGAANATSSAIKTSADTIKTAAEIAKGLLDWTKKKIEGPPATDPKAPPLDPVNPKAP